MVHRPAGPQHAPPKYGVFYGLLLAIVLGMFLMASSLDLLMLYLAVEMVSLLSYAVAGYKPGDRRRSPTRSCSAPSRPRLSCSASGGPLRDPLILLKNIAELSATYLRLIDNSEETTHSCGLHVCG